MISACGRNRATVLENRPRYLASVFLLFALGIVPARAAETRQSDLSTLVDILRDKGLENEARALADRHLFLTSIWVFPDNAGGKNYVFDYGNWESNARSHFNVWVNTQRGVFAWNGRMFTLSPKSSAGRDAFEMILNDRELAQLEKDFSAQGMRLNRVEMVPPKNLCGCSEFVIRFAGPGSRKAEIEATVSFSSVETLKRR